MSKTVTQSQLDRILAANMSVKHSPPPSVATVPVVTTSPAGGSATLAAPVLSKPSQLPTATSLPAPVTTGSTYAEVTRASIITKSIEQTDSSQRGYDTDNPDWDFGIKDSEPLINVQRANSIPSIIVHSSSSSSSSNTISQAPTSLLASIAGERYRNSEKHIERLAITNNDGNIIMKYKKFRQDMQSKVSSKRRSYNSSSQLLSSCLQQPHSTIEDARGLYNMLVDDYNKTRKARKEAERNLSQEMLDIVIEQDNDYLVQLDATLREAKVAVERFFMERNYKAQYVTKPNVTKEDSSFSPNSQLDWKDEREQNLQTSAILPLKTDTTQSNLSRPSVMAPEFTLQQQQQQQTNNNNQDRVENHNDLSDLSGFPFGVTPPIVKQPSSSMNRVGSVYLHAAAQPASADLQFNIANFVNRQQTNQTPYIPVPNSTVSMLPVTAQNNFPFVSSQTFYNNNPMYGQQPIIRPIGSDRPGGQIIDSPAAPLSHLNYNRQIQNPPPFIPPNSNNVPFNPQLANEHNWQHLQDSGIVPEFFMGARGAGGAGGNGPPNNPGPGDHGGGRPPSDYYDGHGRGDHGGSRPPSDYSGGHGRGANGGGGAHNNSGPPDPDPSDSDPDSTDGDHSESSDETVISASRTRGRRREDLSGLDILHMQSRLSFKVTNYVTVKFSGGAQGAYYWPEFLQQWKRADKWMIKLGFAKVDRYHELLKCLFGEAKQICKGITHPTDGSLQEVLDLLQNNYGAKDLLIASIIQKLITLPKIQDTFESISQSYSELKLLTDQLKNLKLTVDEQRLALILGIMQPKLSPMIQREYTSLKWRRRADDKPFGSSFDLSDFLKLFLKIKEQKRPERKSKPDSDQQNSQQNRGSNKKRYNSAFATGGVARPQQKQQQKPSGKKDKNDSKTSSNSSNSTTTGNSSSCIFGCSSAHNKAVFCPKIKTLSWTKLKQAIKDNHACYKCFERNCSFANCKFKDCPKCSGNHNIAFCRENQQNQQKNQAKKPIARSTQQSQANSKQSDADASAKDK